MSAGKIIQISDLPNELKNEPVSEIEINNGSWRDQFSREVARECKVGDPNIYEKFIFEIENILIQEALKATKNRKVDAAKLLGIGRNTITRKIKEQQK